VQSPIEGESFAATLTDPDAPAKHTQFYAMLGQRAVYEDGWLACTVHPPLSGWGKFELDVWELYHLAVDVAENHDVAQDKPEKLKELIDLWWQEAEKYDVLPLDDRGFAERRAASKSRKDGPRTRMQHTYFSGVGHVAGGAVPFTLDRSYSIDAHVTLSPGDEGVIVACGGVCGGYALYVLDGKLVHDYNYYQRIYRVEAALPATRGPATLRYAFEKTGKLRGVGRLFVNGERAGEVEMPATYPYFMDWEGLDVGRDARSPATPAYAGRGEFPFSGKLDRVVITLGEDAGGPGDHEPVD